MEEEVLARIVRLPVGTMLVRMAFLTSSFLAAYEPGLELITVKYDGTDLKTVYPTGSGHPSFHPGGLPLIVTDAYAHEPVTHQDGFVPVRLLNVETGTEELIAQVFVPKVEDSSFRVDAHPTWDRSGRYVIFNGYEDNTRCVYIADLKDIIEIVSGNSSSIK